MGNASISPLKAIVLPELLPFISAIIPVSATLVYGIPSLSNSCPILSIVLNSSKLASGNL
jgi:hypothetical protein